MQWVIIIVCLIVIVYQPYDSTDDIVNHNRSGLTLYVDHGTGCHYIKGGLFGSIVPRLDEEGNQYCEKKKNKE